MAVLTAMKILVAEDDRDIADLIAHYLRKQGWAPHIATTGETQILGKCWRHAETLLPHLCR